MLKVHTVMNVNDRIRRHGYPMLIDPSNYGYSTPVKVPSSHKCPVIEEGVTDADVMRIPANVNDRRRRHGYSMLIDPSSYRYSTPIKVPSSHKCPVIKEDVTDADATRIPANVNN